MTSLGSPDSTTRAALVRSPSRMRWWWTAAAAMRLGIGTRSGPTPRSDSTSTVAPLSSMARPASAHRASTASSSAPTGALRGKTAASVSAFSPGRSRAFTRANSRLDRIGRSNRRWRQCSGVSANRSFSDPRVVCRAVTSSSRMASRGGLVTCAKSCLK